MRGAHGGGGAGGAAQQAPDDPLLLPHHTHQLHVVRVPLQVTILGFLFEILDLLLVETFPLMQIDLAQIIQHSLAVAQGFACHLLCPQLSKAWLTSRLR